MNEINSYDNKKVVHLFLEQGRNIIDHQIDYEVVVTPVAGKISCSCSCNKYSLTLRPGEFIILSKNKLLSISAIYTSDIMIFTKDCSRAS
ncbi:MAG: hypothetical protein ACRC6X_04880 [Culicoidibacterales bacterium]